MTNRIITVDLEPDLRSNNSKSLELVLPKLLDFFDDHKIKATFFTVTSLVEKYETEIKEIAKKHEIASHSHTHQTLTNANAEEEIKNSKEKLKQFKIKCQGFRAPRFITTANHFSLLKKYDYDYDSSLATYYPGRYIHLFLPNRPFTKYIITKDEITKDRMIKNKITEFPIPSIIPPFIDSGLPYLKMLHPISKIFPKKYLFYIHPWEFLENKDLISDTTWNSKLLRHNSGKKAWAIFTDFIQKSEEKETKWISCKQWMEKNLKNER